MAKIGAGKVRKRANTDPVSLPPKPSGGRGMNGGMFVLLNLELLFNTALLVARLAICLETGVNGEVFFNIFGAGGKAESICYC